MERLFCFKCKQHGKSAYKGKVVCVEKYGKVWCGEKDGYLRHIIDLKDIKHYCPDCGEELIYFAERKEDENSE